MVRDFFVVADASADPEELVCLIRLYVCVCVCGGGGGGLGG